MKKSKKKILTVALPILSVSSLYIYILSASTIPSSETINKQQNLESSMIVDLENDFSEKQTVKARFEGTQLDKNAVNSLGWHSKTEITLADWEQAPNVTEIGTGGVLNAPFITNEKLTNIQIPARIKKINNSSFQQTTKLKEVTFEENSQLTSIEHTVFSRSGINAINIPSSVTSIGNNAFGNCSNLRTVTFATNSQLKTIWQEAFFNSGITSIDLPESLQEIRLDAFKGTNSLKGEQVRIPVRFRTERISYGFTPTQWNSIDWKVDQFTGITLTKEAVKNLNWTNKAKITLEDWKRDAPKVTKIGSGNETTGQGSFYNNSRLESIEIPDAITSIGNFAFEGSSKLTTISFGEGSALASLGTSVFQGSKIGKITLPKGVITIPNSAFQSSSITEITFAANSKITSIGALAFASSKLLSINIPDSVTTIGDNAFSETSALVGNKVSMLIKWKASSVNPLYGFKKEQWDTLSWRITPFIEATLTKAGVISLGWDTVSSISAQDWTKYAPNVTKIGTNSETTGQGLFSNNKVLKTIEIPEKVTSIENYVFENSVITSIYIPDTVTTIGTHTFVGTSALEGNQVSMLSTLQGGSQSPRYGFDATQWASIAWRIDKFEGDTLTKEVVISLGWNIERSITLDKWQRLAPNVTKIGTNTRAASDGPFANNTTLETIEIPASITFISNNTFTNASALKNVQLSYSLFVGNNPSIPQFGLTDAQWSTTNWTEIPTGNTTINSIIARHLLKTDSIITWEEIASYTGIQSEAFKDTKITSIIINKKENFIIGDNAFSGTLALTSITISFDTKLFDAENSSLPLFGFTSTQWEAINWTEIPTGNTTINSIIARHLLKTDSIITWEEIASYTGIQSEAFKDTNITAITIKNKVGFTIGNNAFVGTNDLANIEFSENFKDSITNYGFSQSQIDNIKYIDSTVVGGNAGDGSNAGVIAGSISGVILVAAAAVGGFYLYKYLKSKQRLVYEASSDGNLNDETLYYEENEYEEGDYEEEYFEDHNDEELGYGYENYYENDEHEYDDENQFVHDNYLEDESFEDYEEEYNEEDYWDNYE